MIEAYKNLRIEIDLGDRQEEIEVPFTVGLMEKVQETAEKATKKNWLDIWGKNVVDTFREFCTPYLPTDFDHDRAQPGFYALFFSSVRKAMIASFAECTNSMLSTEESTEPTEEKAAEDSE
ncbi:hypothetical protein [Blastopirellula marina]|uniref:hypothetical protein n=1 Tax=Blastopirellula marina TaxID=124 RepID=UPI0011B04CF5|nr:hypothetical protein [Blastopirellula marina]